MDQSTDQRESNSNVVHTVEDQIEAQQSAYPCSKFLLLGMSGFCCQAGSTKQPGPFNV